MFLLLGLLSLVCGHTHTHRPHEKVDLTEEAKDFHVVYPDVVHGKPEGSTHHSRILSANQNDVPGHTQALALEFKAYGKTMRLELTQTADLFAKDFTIANHNIDGTVTHVHPEHCYYHGHVIGLEGSSVTGSTCHGFDGMITTKDERYVIMPAAEDKKLFSRLKHTLGTKMPSKDGSKLGPHVIFKMSDMQQSPAFGCGNGHSHSHSQTTKTTKTTKTVLAKTALTKITKIEEKQLSRKLLACSTSKTYKDWREPGAESCKCKSPWQLEGTSTQYCGGCGNPDSDTTPWCFTEGKCNGEEWAYCKSPSSTSTTPASPASSPTPMPASVTASTVANDGSLFVELLIVNDADQVAKVGGTQAASKYAIKVVNEVKKQYQQFGFGVNIILTQVKNFPAGTEESFKTSDRDPIKLYLDRFTAWYKKDTSRKDNGQLISGADRSGGTTGLAWVGTMCRGSSTGVVENNGNWQFLVSTMAHEMGHNWGMNHDGEGANAGCDDSKYVMAASSCGNCPFNGYPEWSACSKSTISASLQRLGNTPGNCLTNNPGVAFGAQPVCGDGIKSDNEDCDEGSANGVSGVCSTICMLNQGVQCSSGECCQNGKFKAAGTVCRNAMHQCDLVDRCKGNSAQCPSDNYKPDGTACTESGAGSTCYGGSCLGLDGQCKLAYAGYVGTWKSSYTSSSCQCDCMDKDPCGDLKCTNNDDPRYCQMYDCPPRYTCTVNGEKISGPKTVPMCSCNLAPSAETRIRVVDGTPCGTGKMCTNGQCADRPVSFSAAAVQTCTSNCGSNGKCAQKKDSTFACVCSAGYAGNKCAAKVACGTDCSLLHRETCVVDNICGSCLTGTGSATFDDATGLSNCSLTKSNIVGSFSLTRGVDASKDMIDGDVYSHWVESFSSDKEATVQIVLDTPVKVSRYDMISSNSRPAEDPASFTLYGSNDCVTWVKLHSQSNVKFPRRHESRSFLIKDGRSFTVIRLSVKEVADPNAQNQAMVAPTTNVTNTATNEVTVTSTNKVSQVMSGKILKVQLAEFKLYHQQADTSSMTPITKEQCQKALSVHPDQASGVSPTFTLATLAFLLPIIIAAVGN